MTPERPECDGSGTLYEPTTDKRQPCPGCRKCRPCERCDGRGKFYVPGDGWVTPCPDCKGSGIQPSGKEGECDCETEIGRRYGKGWLKSGHRQDGETVRCPRCEREWVHVCDEAEGCSWVPAPDPPAEQPSGKEGETVSDADGREYLVPSDPPAEQPERESNVARPHELRRIARQSSSAAEQPGTEEGKDAVPRCIDCEKPLGDTHAVACPNPGMEVTGDDCRTIYAPENLRSGKDAAGGEVVVRLTPTQINEALSVMNAGGCGGGGTGAADGCAACEAYLILNAALQSGAEGEALTGTSVNEPHSDFDSLSEPDLIVAECDRYGLPHSLHALLRHIRNNNLAMLGFKELSIEALRNKAEAPPSPAAPEGERRWTIWVCPECGQWDRHPGDLADRRRCGDHGSPPPVPITVVPASPPAEGRER